MRECDVRSHCQGVERSRQRRILSRFRCDKENDSFVDEVKVYMCTGDIGSRIE